MSNMQYPAVVGWYIGANSSEPMYDPGLVPCPYCGVTPTMENVRTHNLMFADREPALSVFYRTHIECSESDKGEESATDNFVMSALETMRAAPKPNATLSNLEGRDGG